MDRKDCLPVWIASPKSMFLCFSCGRLCFYGGQWGGGDGTGGALGGQPRYGGGRAEPRCPRAAGERAGGGGGAAGLLPRRPPPAGSGRCGGSGAGSRGGAAAGPGPHLAAAWPGRGGAAPGAESNAGNRRRRREPVTGAEDAAGAEEQEEGQVQGDLQAGGERSDGPGRRGGGSERVAAAVPHAAGARQPHGPRGGLRQRPRTLRQDRRDLRHRPRRGRAGAGGGVGGGSAGRTGAGRSRGQLFCKLWGTWLFSTWGGGIPFCQFQMSVIARERL